MEMITIPMNLLTDEARAQAQAIGLRMGWAPEMGSDLLLFTVPDEDAGLFSFIFGELV